MKRLSSTNQLTQTFFQSTQRRFICTSHVQNNNKGFFSQFVENIRSEFDKNKEMKENIKKFKEEKRKLEQSDALKEARKKFVSMTIKSRPI